MGGGVCIGPAEGKLLEWQSPADVVTAAAVGDELALRSSLLLFAPLCSSSLFCCSGWIMMRNSDSGLKSPKICAFVSAATLTSSSEEFLREIRLIFRNVNDTFQSDFLKAKPTLREENFGCFQRDY